MKKVININFQGTVVPIEESSYELLQEYISSLRRYFANEEGRDEIINDIESRISELFQYKLKNGNSCITDEDVNAIIKNMGRPEDFDARDNPKEEGETESEKTTHSESIFNSDFNWKGKRFYRDESQKILGGVCSGIAAYFGIDPVIVRVLFIVFAFTGFGVLLYLLLWVFIPGSTLLKNGVRKRLYRNPDEKFIAGVCSGLASYFNINAWIPRVLFLLPFVSIAFRWGHWGGFGYPRFFDYSFSPSAIIIYIILWLVIPEATTTSEKLEMKGEKVDMNSIKESVLKEMKDVGERVGKLGAEAGKIAKEKGPEIGQQIHMAANKGGNAFGKVLGILIKIFVYFILGCIGLSIIISLFVFLIVAVGLFPLKNFMLNNGWQTIFAWGTLIFFVCVPVIGITTYIIRRLAKTKSNNNSMSWAFGGLWTIGWIFLILLITSVARDFKGISSMNEIEVELSNPNVKSLTVKPFQSTDFRRNRWFRLEPYSEYSVSEDTAMVGNVMIRLRKSLTDSFQVSYIKYANGNTRRDADTLANLIQFNIAQADSILNMDRAIYINTTDKFRNQNVEVFISIPVGGHIIIDRAFQNWNRVSFDGLWVNNGWNDYNETFMNYNYGVEYVMKEDGLYNMKNISSSKENEWNREQESKREEASNEDSEYRYKYKDNIDSLKSAQDRELLRMQKAVDSVKEARNKEMQRLKDSLKKAKEEIDRKIEKLDKTVGQSGGFIADEREISTFSPEI